MKALFVFCIIKFDIQLLNLQPNTYLMWYLME